VTPVPQNLPPGVGLGNGWAAEMEGQRRDVAARWAGQNRAVGARATAKGKPKAGREGEPKEGVRRSG